MEYSFSSLATEGTKLKREQLEREIGKISDPTLRSNIGHTVSKLFTFFNDDLEAEANRVARAARIEKPDWNKVMEGQAHPHDNERVILTRGSARLALSAIKAQNERDYYHNYGAAARELEGVLSRPVTPDREKLANLTRDLRQAPRLPQ